MEESFAGRLDRTDLKILRILQREGRIASAEIAASEEEIAQLRLREGRLTTSLHARRGTLAEVLGALERMGRRPPPAILVHPDDALGSVRSAILLGSVVPTIRQETDALRRDLDELAALRTDIEEQRQAFAASLQRQREEEGRLARLSQEREKLEADRREALTEMAARGTELAGRASSLEELIGALESDLAAAQAAGAHVIDIRSAVTREPEGHVPGATVIERLVLEWRLDPSSAHRMDGGPGHDDPVIVLCNEGYYSSLAARDLRDLGFHRATDLVGGFRAYAQAGLPVDEEPTRYVD